MKRDRAPSGVEVTLAPVGVDDEVSGGGGVGHHVVTGLVGHRVVDLVL